MNEETKQLLTEGINDNLRTMNDYEFENQDDLKEYKELVHCTTELMDRLIEDERIKAELEERRESRKDELDEKKACRKEELESKEDSAKKDRIIKCVEIGVGVAAGIGGCIVTNVVRARTENKIFKFEETGTLTSTVGKTFFNGLFRK